MRSINNFRLSTRISKLFSTSIETLAFGNGRTFIIIKPDGRLEGHHCIGPNTKTQGQFIESYKANETRRSTLPLHYLLEEIKKTHPEQITNLKKKLNPIITNIIGNIEHGYLSDKYNLCIPPLNIQTNPERSTRNLSKLIHFFPAIKYILEQDPYWGEKLMLDFAEGKTHKSTTNLLNYLEIPLSSRGFFRRISHMRPHLAKMLYDFVVQDLENDNKIDEKSLSFRISHLPLPDIYDGKYKAMQLILSEFYTKNNTLSDQTKAQMFRNIVNQKENWIKNSNVINKNFFRSIDEYAKHIALYLLLPKYVEYFNKNNKGYIFPDKYNNKLTQYVLDELSELIKDNIISKLTPYQASKNSENYLKKMSLIDQARPLFLERKNQLSEAGYQSYPQWQMAFNSREIDGVIFKCLVNEKELKQEQDKLKHCVTNYYMRCLNGSRHIVSGEVLETGELFTIRFDSIGNDIEFGEVVTQSDNSSRIELSKTAKDSIKALTEKIAEHKIPILHPFGMVDKNITIEEAIGCESTQLDELFEVHKKMRCIPNNPQNIEELLHQSKFHNFIKDNLTKHQKMSPQNIPSSKAEKAALAISPRELVIGLD